MNTLALQVQQELGRDPHAGDLYVFRGRRGDLVKILWHDGLGFSLYATASVLSVSTEGRKCLRFSLKSARRYSVPTFAGLCPSSTTR